MNIKKEESWVNHDTLTNDEFWDHKWMDGILTLEERDNLSDKDKYLLSEMYINKKVLEKVIKDTTSKLKKLITRIVQKEVMLKGKYLSDVEGGYSRK